jgi:hypothetical protein
MSDDILTAEQREVVEQVCKSWDLGGSLNDARNIRPIIDSLIARVHAGDDAVETLTQGLAEASAPVPALLDHVAELERELVKCRVIISTHRDSPTLVGANVALRATIARQRRAIYRLSALVFEWMWSYWSAMDMPRLRERSGYSRERIRARLATLEAPHDDR